MLTETPTRSLASRIHIRANYTHSVVSSRESKIRGYRRDRRTEASCLAELKLLSQIWHPLLAFGAAIMSHANCACPNTAIAHKLDSPQEAALHDASAPFESPALAIHCRHARCRGRRNEMPINSSDQNGVDASGLKTCCQVTLNSHKRVACRP
ncbi:uncharacterized protein UMAG_05772 [Mycosarcoma maydis]|uniref:Uncharacterized protein n=1 Tax=Mycosarcoma maydis TaxID=5270 RepID=A0A0D1DWV0_MYCMD|nr:uncharacterized protein UMAG_05772 [Ustilago maydis 521]KIS66990.1 hypothetical protein UMAG_05772 [Ustilago maydis 521]|eukprot:XP_011391505.1 hypothetical protein UMAG_05772 [Ustilago maydis 521]